VIVARAVIAMKHLHQRQPPLLKLKQLHLAKEKADA